MVSSQPTNIANQHHQTPRRRHSSSEAEQVSGPTATACRRPQWSQTAAGLCRRAGQNITIDLLDKIATAGGLGWWCHFPLPPGQGAGGYRALSKISFVNRRMYSISQLSSHMARCTAISRPPPPPPRYLIPKTTTAINPPFPPHAHAPPSSPSQASSAPPSYTPAQRHPAQPTCPTRRQTPTASRQ